MSSTAERFETKIICPKCHAKGSLQWERVNAEISLIGLPKGFHERLSRTPPYPIELACDSCGTTQEEVTPLWFGGARFGRRSSGESRLPPTTPRP